MYVARQADDSFVCFGAKPDKGFWIWDLAVTGSGKRTREESWERELEEGVVEGRWREAVDTGYRSREASRHERVQTSERRSSRHSSSFVEVSLESILALVYTCTMLHNSPSALELTPSVCSFVLFPPTPLIVFL